jgi:hypothetical protein
MSFGRETFFFGCIHVYGDETLLTEMRYELHAWILMEGRHATAGKALAKVLSIQQMKKTQVKASDANLNFKYPASQGNERSGDIPKGSQHKVIVSEEKKKGHSKMHFNWKPEHCRY